MDLLSKAHVSGVLKHDKVFLLKLVLSGIFTALGVHELGYNIELSFVALIFVPAGGLFFTHLKQEADSDILRWISIFVFAVLIGLLIQSLFLALAFFMILEGATQGKAVVRYEDVKWMKIMEMESSMDELNQMVAGHTLFQTLPEEVRADLAEHCSVKELEDGRLLIKQGEFNYYLYLIAKGEVEVIRDQKKVATLHAGDIVGEISASGLGLPVADVVAKNNLLAFAFPIDAIRAAADEYTDFADSLRQIGIRRTRE